MILYIVRHPETEFNKRGIIQGHADSSLTEKGRRTAEKLGEWLKDKEIAKIYSSDLGRCLETSRIINQQLKVKIIQKKELRECNFGDFNGRSATIIRKNFDLKDANLVLPRGESFNQMRKRVLEFIWRLKEEKPILIVAHEGCLRAILSEIYRVRSTSTKCDTNPNEILGLDLEKRMIILKN